MSSRTLTVERISYTIFEIEGGRRLRTWARVGTKLKSVTATSEARLKAKLRKISVDLLNGATEAAELEAPDLRELLAAREELRPLSMSNVYIAARDYAAARAALGDTALIDAARDYAAAKKVLGDTPLIQAAKFYAAHAGRGIGTGTVCEISAKIRTSLVKRSKAYRQVCECDLKRLETALGDRSISDVTSDELQALVDSTGRIVRGEFVHASAFRRKQVRSLFITVWRRAQVDRFLPFGPTAAHGVTKEIPVAAQQPVWDPGHLRRALESLVAHEPRYLPWVAISALANVRSAGARRLDWRTVYHGEDFIELGRGDSKKGKRQLVPICPALKSWLEPYWKQSGPICPPSKDMHGDFCTRLRVRYGIPYYKNVLRRSFISYRLALTGDENLVASEAGTSVQEIRETYTRVRTFAGQLVTKELAEKWFGTTRVAAVNVVQGEFASVVPL